MKIKVELDVELVNRLCGEYQSRWGRQPENDIELQTVIRYLLKDYQDCKLNHRDKLIPIGSKDDHSFEEWERDHIDEAARYQK